ncbi:MAG TPA: SPFH domain-containing protein [Candidatus Acidoferrales bacterium]|nr:SPFH domain-containing protein [Bryobacteraceae bacterium]HTS65148.1 SPFH domain-containing protein [Candidatus Acidoferrales bacterium]
MLTLKYLLESVGFGLMAAGAAILIHAYVRRQPLRWRDAAQLAGTGLIPLMAGISIVVVPAGMAGIRVSQISGTMPGTLYPGLHLVFPLVESVATYDTRDQMFQTVFSEKAAAESLKVQTKEGLSVALAVAVRYRIDANRLAFVHANLPHPVETELVPPVVGSTFREIAPNYLVRDLFAGRREEIRREAATLIARKLAPDAIVVKEVMLRDIQMPAEYARGLEGVLLKEQENERLAVEVDVKAKQVKTAELEAEAEKARQVKAAEAESQVTVLRAKAQADAMQYTLPLKQKQIEQTRLEAEARAQAKVIDGKAELENRKLMNQAEVDRVEVLSKADADRMRLEAGVLKESPLLLQKIIADKLSDKVQIMMVPSDGKFFFANDVLHGVTTAQK